MEKKKILFVDDEQNLLDGLRRMLYGVRAEWDMTFVQSGKEALDLMAQAHYDVLVTDMRMPEMDGAQLLTEVMKRYPFTVRFVLSGQSDKENIIKSAGTAHQYLSKPCNQEMLKNMISDALALRNVLHNEEIRNLVSQIKALPSIPGVYMQLLEELRKPTSSLHTLADIVERDLGLSTKVLQLVNSSFFGLPHKVISIPHAVSFLGIEVLKALVFTVKVFESFESKSHGMFSVEELMTHSIAVATCSKMMMEELHANDDDCENAFLAGCLHDLGKLILASHFPDKFKILQQRHKTNIYSLDPEEELFGANHTEVGAYLLGLWGFKGPVVEAVAYHHSPGRSTKSASQLLSSLFAANLFYYEQQGYDISPVLEAEKDFAARTDLLTKLPVWRSRCSRILKESLSK
ncbi:MAG: hypothetical protein A2X49_13000 [Lentisphaerae bacterium GWF2_52_8]|nr:MAG: hypothetical protein A2X49_13000 [Lentisphaerae bacterium GWF2_52_8]